MLIHNNLEFRNLEEQVQKNKEDIARHYLIDRALANFGIKIVGQVSTENDLPNPLTYTGSYGDAYAVGVRANVEAGTSTYTYYIFTRPSLDTGEPDNHWLDVGKLGIKGDTGDPGPQGDPGSQGIPGTVWTISQAGPTNANIDQYTLAGDAWLNASNGNIYTVGTDVQGNLRWVQSGNIRGPQGFAGRDGNTPTVSVRGGYWFINDTNTGIQAQGPKGDKGDAGTSFHVVGTLASTALLPTPTQEIRAGAYLIPSQADPNEFDMWIIAGDINEGAELDWTNAGQVTGIEGPEGPASTIPGPAGPDRPTIQFYNGTFETDPGGSYYYNTLLVPDMSTLKLNDLLIDKTGQLARVTSLVYDGVNSNCSYIDKIGESGGSAGGYALPSADSGYAWIAGENISPMIGGPCYALAIPKGYTKFKQNKADMYSDMSTMTNYVDTVNLSYDTYNSSSFGDSFKLYEDMWGNTWLFALHYGNFDDGAPSVEGAWLE